MKLGTKEADKLIVEFAPLVKYIAYRLSMKFHLNIDIDDLISSGVIGLLDAIEKYDPEREAQFKTYAEIRIRGAMLDEARAQDWTPRSVRQKASIISKAYQKVEQRLGRAAHDDEVAEELDISIDQFHELLSSSRGQTILSLEDLSFDKDGNKRDIFDIIGGDITDDPENIKRIESIKNLIAKEIDQLPEKEKMVLSLYYYDDLTMKEIGHILGITESRVSQLHTKSALRLRGKLQNEISDIKDVIGSDK